MVSKYTNWGEQLLRRIRWRHLVFALIGEVLVAYGLGAKFSEDVQFALTYIIGTSIISLFLYLLSDFKDWTKDDKVHYITLVYGCSAAFQIIFVFGALQPLPESIVNWLLIAGYVMIIPEIHDMIRNPMKISFKKHN